MLLSKAFLSGALTNAYVKVYKNDGFVDAYDKTVASFWDQEKSISIDSRTINSDEIFLALKGPNFDGHDFVQQALEKGASALVVNNRNCLVSLPPDLLKKKPVIFVPDTLQALIELAKAWRKKLSCPVVGITGSVGKTSTKEILSLILQEASVDSFVSFKNQNNIIGLCLNLLRVCKTHKVAVFELGINERGEMRELVDVVRPTIGLIICVAHAHGQGLGMLQDVAYEKKQIFRYFTHQDIGIICGDQQLLTQCSYSHPIAKFGFKTSNQVQARKVRVLEDKDGNFTTNFILKWYEKKALIVLKGNHLGYVVNALAASTVAYVLRISFDAVVNALNNYDGTEKRFEIKEIVGQRGRLISDCYNANPESMKAALVAFNQMEAKGSKIAVLGDMLELGDKEVYWHRQIGRLLRRMEGIKKVVLVGRRARQIVKTAPQTISFSLVDDWQEAGRELDKLLTGSDSLVLVKASNGMGLGNMVDVFVR